MSTPMSTDSLLESFPVFGHPGISALEYAGQIEAMRKQSTNVSEVSLKRNSTTSTHGENTRPLTTAGSELEASELSPPVHSIDEFGCQQRRRGTFINHTPRNFEMRPSRMVEVYRPSRTDSENYSRPLSRQGSQASTGPVFANRHGNNMRTHSSTMEKLLNINDGTPVVLYSLGVGSTPSPDVYTPSTKSHLRSMSAPPSKILTYEPSITGPAAQSRREFNLGSISASSHQPQEKKRQRRQTPFKITSPRQKDGHRHAPMEPWVAEHRRKNSIQAIGDLPFDMNREISAEMGTFGVIQRYFDSQGGGPVVSPRTSNGSHPPSSPFTKIPEQDMKEPFREPIAIYPIREIDSPNNPPTVPQRSSKRLTNPVFPLSTHNFIADGQCSPHSNEDDVLHVSKKRAQKRSNVGQAAQAGSSNLGKMAPPILGHYALTASNDLGLNDLSYYLKHTGPSPEPQLMPKQRRKKGMKLFKVKQRKTLAARVGSVEGSPHRARKQPAVPACAREMTTSGGARHLKIVIPTETPSGSPVSKLRTQRRSRHVSITFTEEMLSPLASPKVERMISTFETPGTPEQAFSTPVPLSPRRPKRPPVSPKFVPVDNHPLASRDEQTRARKLRDLQRIKRKPVPVRTPSGQGTVTDAVLTPAQTPKPAADLHIDSAHGDSGIDEEVSADKFSMLQERVVSLQMQNTQLTGALAKIIGWEIKDGDLKSEDVLKASWQIIRSRTCSVV
jgi:hypothetical protein